VRGRFTLLTLLTPLLLGSFESPGRAPRLELRRFRLELHVPDQPGLYFTAWSDDAGNRVDVITDHDGADGKTVVYRRRLIWFDGCTWDASEELVPTSADHYTYQYREAPVSCPSGTHADVGAVTPRDGDVTVRRLDHDAPLTPLFAWAHGWDRPR
jgi:hypothetical protein